MKASHSFMKRRLAFFLVGRAFDVAEYRESFFLLSYFFLNVKFWKLMVLSSAILR